MAKAPRPGHALMPDWKSGLARIAALGISPGRRDSVNYRIRISNILALVSMGLAVGYILFYLAIGEWTLLPHTLSGIVLNLVPLILNAKGRITLSRLYIVGVGTLDIAAFSSIYGPDSDFEQFFLALLASTWLFFDHTERRLTYLSTGLIVLTVGLLHWTDYALVPEFLRVGKPVAAAENSFKYLVSGSILSSIILLSYLSSQAERRLEKSLEEANQDRKRLQEQDMRLKASERLAALGELSASIAHEINNPLGVLRLQNERLLNHLDRSHAPDSILEASRKVEAMTVRISKIIRSLQTLARGAEAEPFSRAPIALLVEDALEFVKDKFKTAGFEIHIRHEQPALELDCRPIQISQVILNLLNNAWDSLRDKNRKLAVPLSDFVEIRTRCGSIEGRECILIDITDSGAGVPESALGRMGEAFYSTKPGSGLSSGMGMGLRISRTLIEAHSGSLGLIRASDLTEQPHPDWPRGAQTRFVLTLPLRQS